MKKETKITTLQCPFCDRVIESLSKSQAEYNYRLHREACKKRKAMEVRK
jgi:hypothetical protein